MRIVFATSEFAPLVQSGGLGDAASGLARALVARGHELVVILPAYRSALAQPVCPALSDAGAARLALPGAPLRGRWLAGELAPKLGLRLLDFPTLFDRPGLYGDVHGAYSDEALRFIAFARALAERVHEERPDVLVAHDWHAALSLCVLRTLFDRGPTRAVGAVQVLHNNAYQGRFAASSFALTGLPSELFAPDGLEFYGGLPLLLGGRLWADRIVAVSPSYARELQTPEFGEGLEGVYRFRAARLSGIANGLDTERFDPKSDRALAQRYDGVTPGGKRECRAALLAQLGLEAPEPGRLLVAIGRITAQKGWDILVAALPRLVARGASLVFLGDGERPIAEALRSAARRYPQRVFAAIGWDELLVRRAYAGADALLVPSRFEPCGLVQLTAQRYGALPIAHRVGGLVDTIRDGETGILFAPLAPDSLVDACERAAQLVLARGPERLARELMKLDVSWERPAARWEALLTDVVHEARARI